MLQIVENGIYIMLLLFVPDLILLWHYANKIMFNLINLTSFIGQIFSLVYRLRYFKKITWYKLRWKIHFHLRWYFCFICTDTFFICVETINYVDCVNLFCVHIHIITLDYRNELMEVSSVHFFTHISDWTCKLHVFIRILLTWTDGTFLEKV